MATNAPITCTTLRDMKMASMPMIKNLFTLIRTKKLVALMRLWHQIPVKLMPTPTMQLAKIHMTLRPWRLDSWGKVSYSCVM